MTEPDHSPHAIILASAGAGKTYRLTLEYIRLLFKDVLSEPAIMDKGLQVGVASRYAGQILATTFTRKAANEIQQRILLRLAGSVLSQEAFNQLLNEVDQLRPADASMKEHISPTLLLDMIGDLSWQLSQFKVSTLDSFFQKLASAFEGYLDLPDSLTTTVEVTSDDDPRLRKLRYKALRDILDEKGRVTCLELLRRLHHDNSKRSIHQSLDDIVTTLSKWYRMNPDLDAWQSLDVPTSPLYAQEKLDHALVAFEHTLHETASEEASILKSGLENLTSAQNGDWDTYLKKGLAAKIILNEEKYRQKPIPRKLIQAYQPIIAHAIHQLLSRQKQHMLSLHQLLSAFNLRYTQYRQHAGLLLFDDFPNRLHRHFADVEHYGQEVLYRLDTQLKHILLDEHQDTSLLQWEILRPFLEEIASVSDGSRTLVAVGDQKQAIYGWRGGESEIFDLFEEDLNLTRNTWISLARNYRSSPRILETCNQVFSNLSQADQIYSSGETNLLAIAEKWQNDYTAHIAHHMDQPGLCLLLETCASNKDEEDEHEETSADEQKANEEDVAFEKRLHLIKRLFLSLPQTPTRQHASKITIGILCQKNATAQRYLLALRKLGIPASSESGRKLSEDPGMTCLMAFLMMVEHPDDTAAAYRIIHSPINQVVKLSSTAPQEVRRQSKAWRLKINTLGLSEVIKTLIKPLKNSVMNTTSNYDYFLELTQQFEMTFDPSHPHRLKDFVERLHLMDIPFCENTSDGTIQVMTIHKSKGLEFDHVILPELDHKLGEVKENVLPFSAQDDDIKIVSHPNRFVRSLSQQLTNAHDQACQKRFKEDMCILYVAMTRAKSTLWMLIQRQEDEKKKLSHASILRHTLQGEGHASGIATDKLQQLIHPAFEIIYHHGQPDLDVFMQRQQFTEEAVQASDALRRNVPLPPQGVNQYKPATRIEIVDQKRKPLRFFSTYTSSQTQEAKDLFSQIETPPVHEQDERTVLQERLWRHWLKNITWLEHVPAQAEMIRLGRQAFQMTPRFIKNELDLFLSALHHPVVRGIFTKAQLPEEPLGLWQDRKFAVIDSHKLRQGSFDRVHLLPKNGVKSATLYQFDFQRTKANWTQGINDHQYQLEKNTTALSILLNQPIKAISCHVLFLNPASTPSLSKWLPTN